MQKTRLVIIANTLSMFGGGERWVLEVTSRLSSRFHITIVNPISKNDTTRVKLSELLKRYRLGKVKIVNVECWSFRTKFPGRGGNFLMMLPKAREVLKIKREIRSSDVVYQVSSNPLILTYARLFAKTYKKRFILGLHNPELLKESEQERIFDLKNMMQNILLRQIDEIHAQTETQIKMLERKKYRGKVYYIPHFLYMKPTVDKISMRDDFSVLFVGRLVRFQKGIDILDKIISSVLKKNNKIKFEILGSGEENGMIVKIVRRFPRNVKWHRFVNEKELKCSYKRSSLFIFPSRYETPGLSLIEAQCYGLPAVAFNVQGPKDIMKRNIQGKLIKPFNVSAFSNAIIKYYNLYNKDRSAYYDAKLVIKKIVEEKYGEASFIKKFTRMIER